MFLKSFFIILIPLDILAFNSIIADQIHFLFIDPIFKPKFSLCTIHSSSIHYTNLLMFILSPNSVEFTVRDLLVGCQKPKQFQFTYIFLSKSKLNIRFHSFLVYELITFSSSHICLILHDLTRNCQIHNLHEI